MAIPWQAILVAICLHTLWGANNVAAKLGMIAVPPLWSAFWRFLLGAGCILSWAGLRRIPITPKRQELPLLATLAAMFGIQIAVMNIGIDLTSASIASVITATYPLFIALFSSLFVAGERMTVLRAIGLALAFAGTAIVLLDPAQLEANQGSAAGNWFMLLGAALLGARVTFSTLLLKRHGVDPVRVNLWPMLLALPCFAGGGVAWEQVRWELLGWTPLLGIAYGGIVIAGLGFMVNANLYKRYPPSILGGFGFISPISGVLLSSLLLHETLSSTLWVGLGAVGLGLYLITRK